MKNTAPRNPSCADVELLRRFSLGGLSPAEAEAVERHLLTCEACVATLRSLEVQDSLSQAVRGQAKLPEVFGEKRPLAEELITRLKKLCQAAPETRYGQDEMTSGSVPGLSEICKADLGFLAPAQGPDELGRLGPFRVRRLLGAGGMGVVFEAEDPQLQRKVALKVMRPVLAADPPARQRFLREARAIAAIEHEHIVPIYQVGEEGGVPYLAMPLLKGESLDQRLRREEKLPPAEVLRIGREMAEGLAAAHERGLVHRDIKPGNVWLEGGRGKVRLLDFGLVRPADDDSNLTLCGSTIGTPGYLAPEQVDHGDVDGRADLFSLGCVLYRMITGRGPFHGPSMASMLRLVATATPPAPAEEEPGVPADLSELVMELLAKDPAGRPATAAAVARRLGEIEAHERTRVDPPTLPRPAGQHSHARQQAAGPPRRRWAVAAAGLLLLAGGLAAGAVIYVKTDTGTLEIKTNDPKVKLRVERNGEEVAILDPETKQEVTIRAGKVTLKPDGERVHELELTTDQGTGPITLKRGGKVVATVTRRKKGTPPVKGKTGTPPAKPPVAEKGPDADRKVAEWALSVVRRVTIRVERQEREVGKVADLPKGAFQLVGVWLSDQQRVGDSDLARLKGLTNLEQLSLQGTRVSDAGLADLKGHKGLVHLNLTGTTVTDAGLVNLKGLTNLTSLSLGSTQVGNGGLEHLKGLTNLTSLHLDMTEVGDAGLVHLKGLTNLRLLGLPHTQVSNAGLEHLQGLTKLQELTLGATKVSDAGLEYLTGMTQLRSLSLPGTRVSDAGLQHLLALKNLTYLLLRGTRISAKGLERLRVPFPTADGWEPNREAALAVLGLGGAVHVRPEGSKDDRPIKDAADLPKEYFRLTRASLAGVSKPLGDVLGKLAALTDPEFDRLEALDLSETAVTDDDLKRLEPLTGLNELSLARTQVGAGLAHLKGMTRLRKLVLDGVPVRSPQMVHILKLTSLTELCLACPTLTNLSVNGLGTMKRLERLSLSGSQVTDAGLKSLHGLTSLKELDLAKTKVTAAGVAALQKALPRCHVFSGL
jgi:serine/threonine protein kinase/Leucine-rich repeat (LRR) protein